MDKNAYLDLIPSKNASKERFMAYLNAILDHGASLGTMVETMSDAFELENAVGNQLDTIGALVGVSRTLPFVPATGTREMDDDEYRLVIKMKIGRNVWKGTNAEAIDLYEKLFPDEITISYVDNQDMTVDLFIIGALSGREAEILNATGVLLVPAGVEKTVNIGGAEITTPLMIGTVPCAIEMIDYVDMH